jgi:hypothetical protein
LLENRYFQQSKQVCLSVDSLHYRLLSVH